jgi:hypothetical protein
MTENKFNYGDKVKVINVGGVFSTYDEMAKIMGLENWDESNSPKKNSIAHVVNVREHPCFTDKTIYGIKTEDGKNYIMSEYALEKIKSGSDLDIDTEINSIIVKDIVNLFTSSERKEELLNEINPSNTIQISRDDLNNYYEYSDTVVKDFINNNFKIDGTTTIGAIIELEAMAYNTLQPVIRKNHPECFAKPEFDFSKYVKKYTAEIFKIKEFEELGFTESPIQIRNFGKYKHKGFYLTNRDGIKWEVKNEKDGGQVLIPIKK